MSLWSRIFGRTDRASWPPPAADSLVASPARGGIGDGGADPLAITPWSATRLTGIFQELQQNPSAQILQEARRARQCLARLWLAAPVDQLEILYRSPIGASYRAMLGGPLSAQPLLADEAQWKRRLSQRLLTSFERPETTNVLLAAMGYFGRGKMRVADPLRQVPQWLLQDYAALHDPVLLQRLRQPVGLLGPAGSSGQMGGYGAAPGLGMQPAMPLPVMGQRRGAEALGLVQNREFLGRMSGLINLYGIDPSDQEVRRELIGLRRQMGQIWLDVNTAQIPQLYQSNFGQLYRNLLSCGFTREPLIPEDQQLRAQLAPVVSNMAQPRALNALLAVLPFYQPGKIQFGGGEQHIPAWLLQDINSLYGGTAAAMAPR